MNGLTKCFLTQCPVKDTLLLWYSGQSVQSGSHEKPWDRPKLRDILQDIWSICFINVKGMKALKRHHKSTQWVVWIDCGSEGKCCRGQYWVSFEVGLHLSPLAQPLLGPIAPCLCPSWALVLQAYLPLPSPTIIHTRAGHFFAESSSAAPQVFRIYLKVCMQPTGPSGSHPHLQALLSPLPPVKNMGSWGHPDWQVSLPQFHVYWRRHKTPESKKRTVSYSQQ